MIENILNVNSGVFCSKLSTRKQSEKVFEEVIEFLNFFLPSLIRHTIKFCFYFLIIYLKLIQ